MTDEYSIKNDAALPAKIPARRPTLAALLREGVDLPEQREHWDRLRALCVDLQLTAPTLDELRTQLWRADTAPPPPREEKESLDDYRRRAGREIRARPKMSQAANCLILCERTTLGGDRCTVELDLEIGALTTVVEDNWG